MNTEETIERYLLMLRRALRGLPPRECDEIISEIRAHLRESSQLPGCDVQSAIAHLGTPQELAALYLEDTFVQRTAKATSPWSILGGAARLARTSALGFLCFMLSVAGYGGGIGMILTACAKPLFPQQIGLWVGPGIFNFGWHSAGQYQGGIGLILATGGPAHELLGWWYIPVALAIGALFIWGTTKLVRKLVRQIKVKRPTPFLSAPLLLNRT